MAGGYKHARARAYAAATAQAVAAAASHPAAFRDIQDAQEMAFEAGWDEAIAAVRGKIVEAVIQWREEYGKEGEGEDVVTPFDHLLYTDTKGDRRSATQAMVVEWAEGVFGPGREQAAWMKLFEEIGEVLKKPGDRTEWGDIFILLYDLADMHGVNPDVAVVDKLRAMRKRQWYTTATGTKQHITENNHE